MNTEFSARRLAIAVLTAVTCLVAVAPSAFAGTITTGYYFNEDGSETNTISVTRASSTTIEITDSSATLNESSSSCTKSGSVVTCNVNSGGTTLFTWNLGDENDSLDIASDVNVKDTVDGGGGGDLMTCGGGKDTINYSSRTQTVFVSPNDGEAYDGEAVEFDDVDPSCEGSTGGSAADYIFESDAGSGRILGGNGADIIIGSDVETDGSCASNANDLLWGQAGDDTIVAGAGDNYLSGDSGDDYLLGDGGCDYILGGSGADTLVGGAGDDTLLEVTDGGAAANFLDAGTGNDDLTSANGADTLIMIDGDYDESVCGDGTDTIFRDYGDTSSNCENETVVPEYYESEV